MNDLNDSTALEAPDLLAAGADPADAGVAPSAADLVADCGHFWGGLRRAALPAILGVSGAAVFAEKGCGIACGPAETGAAGDFFALLRAHTDSALAGRLQKSVQLRRAFDPLDGPAAGDQSDASGAVALAFDDASLAALAGCEIQGRVWLATAAGVVGWPAPTHQLALHAIGVALRRIGIEVVDAHRHGERAVVHFRHQSGKLHHLRGILHGLGVQVAGPQTRSAACWRLLLHRTAIEVDGRAWPSELPADFANWLGQTPNSLGAAKLHSAQRLWNLVAQQPVPVATAMRLVDGCDSGWYVDAYADTLVAHRYVACRADQTDAVAACRRDAAKVCALLGRETGAEAVWLVLRPRQTNTVGDAMVAGLTSPQPAWQRNAQFRRAAVVVENGVHYRVRFDQGFGTGLYLDQRDNRNLIKELSSGRRLLNTFAYTGAFSAAAACGGAKRTVSIDAAASACQWARENLQLNGFDDAERHDVIRGDVMAWLPKMARRGDRFDWVIADPPSHSKLKSGRFSATRDYPALAAMLLRLLDSGGTMLACINDRDVAPADLGQMVLAGARDAGVAVQLRHLPCQPDFAEGRMKSLLAVRQP